MFCQNCGAPLDANAAACAHCGQPAFVNPSQTPPSNANPYAPPYPPSTPQTPYYVAGTNPIAVLGFVFTVVPLVPFAGIVLSIIGWVQCNRTHERGKGLAVAGVILNIVGWVLLALCIVLFAGIIVDNASDFLPDEFYEFAYAALAK
ncbi:MAG: DUF4190 domain-containing protein [Oscillospiraceae bacterium]|jgi:hypothetical protein|nr:DUF4190 domain-containing protein [Oscillospiraceae bacterium]